MILGTGTANFTLKEELCGLPTVANFATVQEEGGRKVSRNVEHYTLDMILSVGYRVKSQNGILFRQWANQVLKEHLPRGASINQRFMLTEERFDRQLINHEKRLDELNSKGVETNTRQTTLEKITEETDAC